MNQQVVVVVVTVVAEDDLDEVTGRKGEMRVVEMGRKIFVGNLHVISQSQCKQGIKGGSGRRSGLGISEMGGSRSRRDVGAVCEFEEHSVVMMEMERQSRNAVER